MARATKPRSIAQVQLSTPGQIKRELGVLYRLAKAKRLDTLDALRLARILGIMLHVITDVEFEQRLCALEAHDREVERARPNGGGHGIAVSRWS